MKFKLDHRRQSTRKRLGPLRLQWQLPRFRESCRSARYRSLLTSTRRGSKSACVFDCLRWRQRAAGGRLPGLANSRFRLNTRPSLRAQSPPNADRLRLTQSEHAVSTSDWVTKLARSGNVGREKRLRPARRQPATPRSCRANIHREICAVQEVTSYSG